MQNDLTGIICAMPVEMALLLEQLKEKKEREISGIRFYEGLLGSSRAVLAVSGIGKVAAAMCAEAMALAFSPARILNTGVAGSLSGELEILDTVVPEDFVQHDMDTSPLGDEKGFLSGINRIQLPCDPALIAAISEAASGFGRVKGGIVASGDQFLADRAKKDEIARLFGAVACEMEGGAIAQVCYTAKIPFAAIRVISDSYSGRGEMEYAAFAPRAAALSSGIVLSFLNQKEAFGAK